VDKSVYAVPKLATPNWHNEGVHSHRFFPNRYPQASIRLDSLHFKANRLFSTDRFALIYDY
jgi:hypothetical protein